MKRKLLAIAAAISMVAVGIVQASPLEGTYAGKARILVEDEATWVEVQVTIEDGNVGLVVSKDEQAISLDAKAFVDKRGSFFGILLQDETIVAGIGGRIHATKKHGRIVGRFIQDTFSRPFILKKVKVVPENPDDDDDDTDDDNDDDDDDDDEEEDDDGSDDTVEEEDEASED